MTWNYKQAEQDWLDTEAGKFLKKSELNGLRVANAIMRYYIYQFNPWSGVNRGWRMEGTIDELELIANGDLSVTGIGNGGMKDLSKVLAECKGKDNDSSE